MQFRTLERTMLDAGKRNVLGILMNIIDYEGAVDFIVRTARARKGAAVSALAVHGLMTGAFDREQKFRLNHFDLLVPDGQPVRWVLNWLYRAGLGDRVYGPDLTRKVCARAASERLPVYFYGSTPDVLASLRAKLEVMFPGLIIAGMKPSLFRRLRPEEKIELAWQIRSSGAAITFVGLGCPRQEAFAYEFRDHLQMPILAVGAAFPFLAGITAQAPRWMQDAGLEWLFRLGSEPGRLWRRYLLLNPAYLFCVAAQALGVSRFPTDGQSPTQELLYG
jgi:N-acetylglucosaminyldiphosphoundecaprenol N-acetyl-beta-D-mannosaminyltransferase